MKKAWKSINKTSLKADNNRKHSFSFGFNYTFVFLPLAARLFTSRSHFNPRINKSSRDKKKLANLFFPLRKGFGNTRTPLELFPRMRRLEKLLARRWEEKAWMNQRFVCASSSLDVVHVSGAKHRRRGINSLCLLDKHFSSSLRSKISGEETFLLLFRTSHSTCHDSVAERRKASRELCKRKIRHQTREKFNCDNCGESESRRISREEFSQHHW